MKDRLVNADGLRLHVTEAGEGRPVVLLHGFPDSCYVWRLQVPRLTAAGYRVIAPDLPGYGRSEIPRAKGGYTVRALASRLAALIESVAEQEVVLAGHDWGGLLSWRLARDRPDLIRRLVILNAPHPRVFRRKLMTTRQLFRSWYAAFFQLPWLPERILQARDFAVLRRALRRATRPGAFTDEDMARHVQEWSRPGALSAALAYYRMSWRAAPRQPPPSAGSAARAPDAAGGRRRLPSRVPTLVIWGERDPFLDIRNLQGLEDHVADLTVVTVPEAGHWVQLDAPERVTRLIADFAGR